MSAALTGANSIGMNTTRGIAEAVKQGQVLRALGGLGDGLARLNDRVRNLNERLGSILAPIPPANEKDVNPCRNGSEIANRVDGYADFVEQMDRQISEIISRLEI